jgi:hypothetical protein
MRKCAKLTCTNQTSNKEFCSYACSNAGKPRRQRKCIDGVSICTLKTCGCQSRRAKPKATPKYSWPNVDKMLNEWLAGERSCACASDGRIAQWARRYLLEQANYSCSRCGFNENHPITGRTILQIDHIDGDRKNDRVENFRVLCPNCHGLTATWGGLNTARQRVKATLPVKAL